MNKRILDTSVAIAWYLPETFSVKARQWQQLMLSGQTTFLVPSLHFWEFANVLRTYVRRHELSEDLAQAIYHCHLRAPLEVVDPDRGEVLATALRYDATVYDAVYLTLALSRETPLLTAEKTTTGWVVKLGSQVESIS